MVEHDLTPAGAEAALVRLDATDRAGATGTAPVTEARERLEAALVAWENLIS